MEILKCEICGQAWRDNYDEEDELSVEEYENLTTEGRCTDCIGEYGTDGYPDR